MKTMTPSKAKPASTTPSSYDTTKPAKVVIRKATDEEIARRAYEIYVMKGRPPGQCMQNWLQAEKELRNQGPAAHPVTSCP